MRLFAAFSVFFIANLFLANHAYAHIKWFSSYDLTHMPNPPVFFFRNYYWVFGMVASLIAISGAIFLDKKRFSNKNINKAIDFIFIKENFIEYVIRFGVSVWLLWICFLPQAIYLTPETTSQYNLVRFLQIILAFCCAFPKFCWVAGTGIFLLFLLAVGDYGIFHLMDYPIFIGLSFYLISISALQLKIVKFTRFIAMRDTFLGVSFAMTMAWGALEKWSYPEWTIPVLEARPYLAFGIEFSTFITLAGWVEWAAAFLIVFGGAISRKAAALFLFIVMIGAVFEFGQKDFVGHLPMLLSMVCLIFSNKYMRSKNQCNPLIFSCKILIQKIFTYFCYLLLYSAAYFGFWYLGYGDFYCLEWADLTISIIFRATIFLTIFLTAVGFLNLLRVLERKPQ